MAVVVYNSDAFDWSTMTDTFGSSYTPETLIYTERTCMGMNLLTGNTTLEIPIKLRIGE